MRPGDLLRSMGPVAGRVRAVQGRALPSGKQEGCGGREGGSGFSRIAGVSLRSRGAQNGKWGDGGPVAERGPSSSPQVPLKNKIEVY